MFRTRGFIFRKTIICTVMLRYVVHYMYSYVTVRCSFISVSSLVGRMVCSIQIYKHNYFLCKANRIHNMELQQWGLGAGFEPTAHHEGLV
jgi:hypothetical protein